jgi:hypothetical protein
MSLSGLEKAILLSISYSNIFSFPLNSREIWLRLISSEKVSHQRVKEVLEGLLFKNFLKKDGQYYSIIDKATSQLRDKRATFSQKKRQEVDFFISKARLFPFIKAIVITGSLSVNNAKENDDIDWLIITQDNTLWIVRPLLIVLATFYGKRRERNGDHRDNSWCFNMFLSESNLLIEEKNQSIYTAYEVCQADFVYDRGGIEKKFLFRNNWVKKYLKNFWNDRIIKKETKEYFNLQENKNLLLTKILNNLLFMIQYQYMRNAITREVVKKDLALFHPRDTHGNILIKWKKILKDVKKRTD